MQFLTLLSLLILLAAVITVYTQNPIYSVLGLILVFFGASILLFLLEVEFLAMIFLVVYIGAIAVLFLFVVMMLDLRIKSERDIILTGLGYITIIFFFIWCIVLFFGSIWFILFFSC